MNSRDDFSKREGRREGDARQHRAAVVHTLLSRVLFRSRDDTIGPP